MLSCPELLSPAGSLEALKYAVMYGADAVYCALPRFGMRAAPVNLTIGELHDGCIFAHARGKKVYLTLNNLPTNDELSELPQYIKDAAEAGVDAFIIADLGVLSLAKQYAPDVDVHFSTQAGITNYAAATMAYNLGAKRVVLARELTLTDIAQIRDNTPPELELEAFVHGAMCMAFSGRCLFSNYLTGRDGNHGECAQPCRWKYSIVEEKRPGQYFPIEQTENGAYLFNSQDMNMLEHIDDLIDSGATSLKIEGRSKSAYYIAAMTNAYKTAVNQYMVERGFEDAEGNEIKPFHDMVIRPDDPDFANAAPDNIEHNADKAFAGVPDAEDGQAAPQVNTVHCANIGNADDGNLSYHARSTRRKSNTAAEILPEGWHNAAVRPAPHVELPDWLKEEPYKVAHRDYSTGFYYPQRKATQRTDRAGYFRSWLVVGEALSWSPDEGGRLTMMSRNKIEPGQQVEFLLAGEPPLAYTVPDSGLRDADGNPVAAINNPAHVFSIPCPHNVPANTAIRSRTKQATLKAE